MDGQRLEGLRSVGERCGMSEACGGSLKEPVDDPAVAARALELKDLGNKAFRREEWQEALEHYHVRQLPARASRSTIALPRALAPAPSPPSRLHAARLHTPEVARAADEPRPEREERAHTPVFWNVRFSLLLRPGCAASLIGTWRGRQSRIRTRYR